MNNNIFSPKTKRKAIDDLSYEPRYATPTLLNGTG